MIDILSVFFYIINVKTEVIMALIYNEEMKKYNQDNRQIIKVKINSQYKWDFSGYTRNNFSVWITPEFIKRNHPELKCYRVTAMISSPFVNFTWSAYSADCNSEEEAIKTYKYARSLLANLPHLGLKHADWERHFKAGNFKIHYW